PCGYVKINYDGSKRQHMSTGDAEFIWIPREDNKAADLLAKQFYDSPAVFNPIYNIPVSITQILHEDYYSTL
ncbi:unnamed protein product, partial [Brassica napus]